MEIAVPRAVDCNSDCSTLAALQLDQNHMIGDYEFPSTWVTWTWHREIRTQIFLAKVFCVQIDAYPTVLGRSPKEHPPVKFDQKCWFKHCIYILPGLAPEENMQNLRLLPRLTPQSNLEFCNVLNFFWNPLLAGGVGKASCSEWWSKSFARPFGFTTTYFRCNWHLRKPGTQSLV